MPSRWITLAIGLFWVAMAAWLGGRELWPQLRPGEPPGYTIDLADQVRREGSPTRWVVTRDEEKFGQLMNRVRFRETDQTFEITGEMRQLTPSSVLMGWLQVHLQDMTSTYRVNRDGDLIEFASQVTTEFTFAGTSHRKQMQASGTIQDGRMAPRWLLGEREVTGEVFPVRGHGSVMNPLHPVNRLADIYPGRSWTMVMVDPFRPAMRSLEAKVHDEGAKRRWAGREEELHVIDYCSAEGDIHIRTWVRKFDGLVIRQEAHLGETHWLLERDGR